MKNTFKAIILVVFFFSNLAGGSFNLETHKGFEDFFAHAIHEAQAGKHGLNPRVAEALGLLRTLMTQSNDVTVLSLVALGRYADTRGALISYINYLRKDRLIDFEGNNSKILYTIINQLQGNPDLVLIVRDMNEFRRRLASAH